MLKTKFLVVTLCVTLTNCIFLNNEIDKDEPIYNARIAWDSGLYCNSFTTHTVDGGGLYFYERPSGYTTVNIYTLTKLNVENGKLLWRTFKFSDIVFCQPMVIGDYIYVFLEPNFILCFDTATGEHTATVEVQIQGSNNVKLSWNITAYQEHFYMGLWSLPNSYFARLDSNLIKHNDDPDKIQPIMPEILWEPESRNSVTAKQILYNNVVYTSTFTPLGRDPVEVAGFDINSGQMLFYITFGGPDENNDNNILYEDGAGVSGNPILIYDDVLYYLGNSISAWNLNTGEKLYRYIFTYDMPRSEIYSANTFQAVFFKDKIFYTSSSSYNPLDSYHNIHCIDQATGNLVWSTVAKGSESLFTNPIIVYGQLYITQHHGFFVYQPETGKLLGVDRSFHGTGMGRNVLYNDYIICIREDVDGGKLVAVNVGGEK
jgi:outer membrane protein assembly factor BamB